MPKPTDQVAAGARGEKANNGIEPIPCKYDLEY